MKIQNNIPLTVEQKKRLKELAFHHQMTVSDFVGLMIEEYGTKEKIHPHKKRYLIDRTRKLSVIIKELKDAL